MNNNNNYSFPSEKLLVLCAPRAERAGAVNRLPCARASPTITLTCSRFLLQRGVTTRWSPPLLPPHHPLSPHPTTIYKEKFYSWTNGVAWSSTLSHWCCARSVFSQATRAICLDWEVYRVDLLQVFCCCCCRRRCEKKNTVNGWVRTGQKRSEPIRPSSPDAWPVNEVTTNWASG